MCVCVCMCACVKQSTPLTTPSSPPLPSPAQTQASQHLKLIKHKSPQRHRCNLKPILTFRGSFINLFASLLPLSSTFLIHPTECCFKMKTFATPLLTKCLNFRGVLNKRSTFRETGKRINIDSVVKLNLYSLQVEGTDVMSTFIWSKY